MKQRDDKRSYILTIFDEQGKKCAEYHGDDDLKPGTANVLLLNFRLFKLVLQILGILLGFVIGEFISSLL